jgi:hypothetical protein
MTDEEIRRQVMEFDKSRVYTALNADELKVGSKVIVSDNITSLKDRIAIYNEGSDEYVTRITNIQDEEYADRFEIEATDKYVSTHWSLAYLVSEPGAIKFEDIKIGDVVSDDFTDLMVLGVDRLNNAIYLPRLEWVSDVELIRYHKKEANND